MIHKFKENIKLPWCLSAEELILLYFILFRTFNQTVGTFEELQKYLEGYVANLTRDDEKRHAK